MDHGHPDPVVIVMPSLDWHIGRKCLENSQLHCQIKNHHPQQGKDHFFQVPGSFNGLLSVPWMAMLFSPLNFCICCSYCFEFQPISPSGFSLHVISSRNHLSSWLRQVSHCTLSQHHAPLLCSIYSNCDCDTWTIIWCTAHSLPLVAPLRWKLYLFLTIVSLAPSMVPGTKRDSNTFWISGLTRLPINLIYPDAALKPLRISPDFVF